MQQKPFPYILNLSTNSIGGNVDLVRIRQLSNSTEFAYKEEESESK